MNPLKRLLMIYDEKHREGTTPARILELKAASPAAWEAARASLTPSHPDALTDGATKLMQRRDVLSGLRAFSTTRGNEYSQVCEDLSDLVPDLVAEITRLREFNESGLVCSKHWMHPSLCCKGTYAAMYMSSAAQKTLEAAPREERETTNKTET
jgi:hypothetical protein